MSTNGQLLIGGTSGPAVAVPTGGDGLTVTVGDGTLEYDLNAALTTVTSVTYTSLKVGRGTTDTYIDFGTDDKIQLKPANAIALEVETTGIDVTGNITSSANISSSLAGTVSAGSGSYHILQGDTSQNTALFIGGSVTASGAISASGTITGNSIVGTLATAAQTNITSLGTLGSLTVSGDITANGNIVGDDGTDITNIETIECDNIVHDGDTDTKIAFSTDSITLTAGNVDMITLDENSNDIITFGNVQTKFEGHITASGNISGSNNLIMHRQFDLPGATGTTQGDIVYFGSPAPDFAEGKLHCWKSNGTWALADKDAELTSGATLLGFALGSAVTDGILLRGMFMYGSDLGTLADVIYVGDSGVTTNDISGFGTGDFIRVIGYLLESTNGTIWFNPDTTYIEKA